MAEKDYYKTLDLSRDASEEDVKKAYRALAMRYHPDRNRGNEGWAHDKFIEINEAFNVLSDAQKRRRYDNLGVDGNIEDIFGNQSSRDAFTGFADGSDEGGIAADLMDDVFADSLRGTSYAFQAFRRRFDRYKKAGFQAQTNVDFENLFEQARGFSEPGSNYEIVLTTAQACNGIEKELVRNGKRLRVKIPAGVKSGSRIKLSNARLTTDGRPGDISIIVEVKEGG